MKNIILFPIILVVIIYFGMSFVIPSFQEGAALRAEVEAQEVRKAKLDDDLRVVQTFVASINQHKDEQNFLAGFIPGDPREQDIVNAVSRLTEESGVSLFTIGFSDQFNNRGYRTDDKEQTVQYVEGTMNVVGTYDNMYAFLTKVFRMNRLYAFNEIHIEKVDVDKTDENASDQPAQLQVTASFQYAYTPQDVKVNIAQLHDMDYTTVSRVQDNIAKTEDIGARAEKRANPFIP